MGKSENEKIARNCLLVYSQVEYNTILKALESKDKEIERLDKIANQRTATPSEYEREKHRLTKAAFDGVGEKVEELREEIAELKEDLDKQYDILIGWEKDYKKEKARSQGLLEALKETRDQSETYAIEWWERFKHPSNQREHEYNQDVVKRAEQAIKKYEEAEGVG